ncbi:M61 family metallopeptidase [Fulvivirga sediminis]|uniref:M61 family metallopeptidase n=1 Tax=Fulvivirga sediminis TaxID=2803949 RepID=A0A937FBL7_9BACT|nr:PDZ domain-containing protein [Fulvivirga sediminis]MBL3657483.1 M61 family metallopeptidase [Fulvivirga sediminis]
MKNYLIHSLFIVFVSVLGANAQVSDTIRYEVSFPNIKHHEAEISVNYEKLKVGEPLYVRMSLSSPGRYAFHQFGKNVYDVNAYNGKGNQLTVTRVEPEVWEVKNHDGRVKVSYKLFANHPDGTYAGIDPLFVHFNMPAVFMWARGLDNRPISVKYNLPIADWDIATQLKPTDSKERFVAEDLQYFMDSPTIMGDLILNSFVITDNDGSEQDIHVALNRGVDETVAKNYTTMVEKVVKEEQKVYGEVPDYDYGNYIFLCGYGPEFHGDGMEHRNSTMVTSSSPLAGNENQLIRTVAHEFFHCWNVERIRPKSLEPFDFENTNMSGELWFAEGFTSYYTELSLVRAGIHDEVTYGERMGRLLNYVINSGGMGVSSPVEMSKQAPFVDAATAVDPTNFVNTFTSYYTYGAAIGLALDLEIRTRFNGLSLDDLMRAMWVQFGKKGIPYTNDDIKQTLAKITEDERFADQFFADYIYGTKVPDYKMLLSKVGYSLEQASNGQASLGAVSLNYEGGMMVSSPPSRKTALYKAGIDVGDVITSIEGKAFASGEEMSQWLAAHKPGDTVEVKYSHFGESFTTQLTLEGDASYSIKLAEEAKKKTLSKRQNWLNP